MPKPQRSGGSGGGGSGGGAVDQTAVFNRQMAWLRVAEAKREAQREANVEAELAQLAATPRAPPAPRRVLSPSASEPKPAIRANTVVNRAAVKPRMYGQDPAPTVVAATDADPEWAGFATFAM